MGSAELNRVMGTGNQPGVAYFYFSYYYFTTVCPVPGEV